MDQPEKRSSISAKRSVARLPLSVIALGVVSLFNDSAGDMINPLLPAFVASVGGGPEALGLIEGIADAIASILQLGSGYLADRLGRLKAVTMVGYAIAAISRPLLAFAVAPWQILITRFGDRVGKGIRGAPRDRLIADAASPEIRGRSFGFHRAMDNAGALVGSLVVYVLLGVGTKTRTIFLWTAVPGLLSLTILGGAVREVKAPSSPSRIEVGVPDSPKFRRFLVALFVFTLGSASDSFLLWRAREVGIPMLYAPLLLLILASVKVASSIPGGELSDRLGRRKTIVAGWILYGCVYLGFAFASIHWQIWALFAVYGLFFGLTEGAERAMAIDLVDGEWRGRALGAYQATTGFALLPASVLFGVLYQKLGATIAFGFPASLALLASLLLPPDRPGDG